MDISTLDTQSNTMKIIEVNKLKDINDSLLIDNQIINKKNWLYLFTTKYYDPDVNKKIDNEMFKIGKTKKELIVRLKQYNYYNTFTNIYAINCDEPDKRERLMKAYIKKILCILPIYGQEYFNIDYNQLKNILTSFANFEVSIINKAYDIYNNNRIICFNKDLLFEENIENNEQEITDGENSIAEDTDEDTDEETNEETNKDYSTMNNKKISLEEEYMYDHDEDEDEDNENTALLKCSLCNEIFKSKRGLTFHKRKNHSPNITSNDTTPNNSISIKCDYCLLAFTTISSRNRHMLHNCKSKPSVRPFEIKQQQKEFNKKEQELKKINLAEIEKIKQENLQIINDKENRFRELEEEYKQEIKELKFEIKELKLQILNKEEAYKKDFKEQQLIFQKREEELQKYNQKFCEQLFLLTKETRQQISNQNDNEKSY